MTLETFILDTGATEHLVRKELSSYMRKIEELSKPINIIVANNKIMTAYKRGQLVTKIKGREITIDALIVEDLRFNLLSLSKIVSKGFKIKIDVNGLELCNRGFTIHAQLKNKLYTLRLELFGII